MTDSLSLLRDGDVLTVERERGVFTLRLMRGGRRVSHMVTAVVVALAKAEVFPEVVRGLSNTLDAAAEGP